MSDPPSYALQVAPESALVFNLISSTEPGVDGTPRCAMTLTHTNRTDEYLAFKVKTTQPRRYLVRPNQGLVAPGKTESVSIILVEKDKQLLLQSFDRLGQSALDHSKDKFLVQSCAVSQEFATRYVSEKKKADQLGEGHKTSKDLAEALTGMWNAVAAGDNVSIFNKKLHVRHVVPKTDASSSSSNTLGVTSTAATTSSATSAAVLKSLTQDDKGSSSMSTKNLDNLSPEEMHVELTNIRRKYDELVSFSVNLTAERDILNNTLEQTKRDLNREMAARALAENKGASSSSSSGSMSSPPAAASGFALSMMQLVVLAVACFVAGVKLNSRHTSSQSNSIPLMDESEEAAAP